MLLWQTTALILCGYQLVLQCIQLHLVPEAMGCRACDALKHSAEGQGVQIQCVYSLCLCWYGGCGMYGVQFSGLLCHKESTTSMSATWTPSNSTAACGFIAGKLSKCGCLVPSDGACHSLGVVLQPRLFVAWQVQVHAPCVGC